MRTSRARAAESRSMSYSTNFRPCQCNCSRSSAVNGHEDAPYNSRLSVMVAARMNGVDQRVVDRRLNLLDPWDVVAGNHQGHVGEPAPDNLSTVVSEQRDGEHSTFARLLQRGDDVGRASARGDGKSDVSSAAVRDQLSLEHRVAADVVDDGAQICRLHRDGDGPDRRIGLLGNRAVDDEVVRVGGGTAIPKR